MVAKVVDALGDRLRDVGQDRTLMRMLVMVGIAWLGLRALRKGFWALFGVAMATYWMF